MKDYKELEEAIKPLADDIIDNLNFFTKIIEDNKPHYVRRVYRIKDRRIYKILYVYNPIIDSMVLPTKILLNILKRSVD